MTSRVTRELLEGLTPDEGAALWLVRQTGDGPIADTSLFEGWLAQNVANHDAWERARRMWERFEDAPVDLLAQLRAEALAISPVHETTQWRRYAVLSAVAATLLLCVVTMLHTLAPNHQTSVAQLADDDRVLATGRRQRASVQLADGTRVQLDTDTKMRVAYSGMRRHVLLDHGRAFFDVAHDAAHPFSVTASGRTITALGTRFDVQVSADRLRVLLVQGRVQVTSATGQALATLTPGQQFSTGDGAGKVTNDGADASKDSRSGVVQFDDTSLSDAVAEMNRHSTTQLVIADPAIGKLRISGRFRSGDASAFGRLVAQILPLRVVATSSGRLELRALR